MSAIFISHSSKDNAWAGRIAAWLKDEQRQRPAEHRYDALFLDFDPEYGIRQGQSWRATLYRKLQVCRAMIVVCSRHYCASQWCLAELGIAIHEGKLVLPVRIDRQKDHSDLPRLLRETQAWVLEAIVLEEESAAGWRGLERGLEGLSWRERLTWQEGQCPYPGLRAFSRNFAAVFFGRDAAITRVQQKLNGLAERSPGCLLLLGASGCGKSSLVRAGVVPQLVSGGERNWLVLEPFSPGRFPFAALHRVLREPLAAVEGTAPPAEAGSDGEAAGLVNQLQWLRSVRQTPVVLVIDQFEELLSQLSGEGEQPSEGERFLAFLQKLLSEQVAGVMVLATMRTDFLDLLQSRWPDLVGLATTETLEPIRPEDFAELITGPAARSGLTLQPGLTERLVSESGGRDALPLLAFTLEELWQKQEKRGVPVAGPNGAWWDLTVEDYDALGGVEGSVSTQAALCWNPDTSSAAEKAALREAFLDHLVTLSEDGRAAKRAARLVDLPERSRLMVGRFVNAGLLVSDAGVVEIAHEALLRTWEPLKDWLVEGREELERCRRVRRLCEDLSAESLEQQRRGALEQLAGMAARGGSEARAVVKEAVGRLAALLRDPSPAIADADKQDAAVVLALIGAEAPLQELLTDGAAPLGVRRGAAETLGLLARHSGDVEQRERIKAELERWLRSQAVDVLVTEESDWGRIDGELPVLQGAARGLQLATSRELPLLGTGVGQAVPMLTLTALHQTKGKGLRVRTEVVDVPVWKLPLPEGEQLEMVVVRAGEWRIGSTSTSTSMRPADKKIAYVNSGLRERCELLDECPPSRSVKLDAFAISRFPITQFQWGAVSQLPKVERRLDPTPGSFRSMNIWEIYGQPGGIPVDSVSWHDCTEWLSRLNIWLAEYLENKNNFSLSLRMALPSESQWEVACRAKSTNSFHFGTTLDPRWANFDGTYSCNAGSKDAYRKRLVPIGAFGYANKWGLAEMHGQLNEWCCDQWCTFPTDASMYKQVCDNESVPSKVKQRLRINSSYRLLRGGCWFYVPAFCSSAVRYGHRPEGVNSTFGFRICCPVP